MKKTIKKIAVLGLLIGSYNLGLAWGETGHRVVGEVAFQNAKKRTIRKINKLVNYESLASLSTFGDEIKSDSRYKKFYSWHFVNFDHGQKYEDAKRNPEGDLIQGINYCIAILKDKNASNEDKAFYLKMLVHFVGDLHQPLHVGHEFDKGGNDIKLKWFGAPSNLHRVWDENMIEQYAMSYTELSKNLPYKTKEQIKTIKSGDLMNWIYESQQLASGVYNSAKADENLSYRYMYDNFALVKDQLQKGGFRLAKILDEIFS